MIVDSLYTPALTEALYARAPFGNAEAVIAVEKARTAAKAIYALLFPEGDLNGS